MDPNSSNHFLYLRAIQGHSGDNVVDLALQDNRYRARFKELHKVPLASFDEELYKNAEVIEGEEVMTLRLEQQRTHGTRMN